MAGSDIPSEIIENIRKRLNTKIDASRLRAVSLLWRSYVPPFKKQLLLPIRVRVGRRDFTFYDSVFYHLAPPASNATGTTSSSSRGWVIKISEGRELGDQTQMLNPVGPFYTLRLPNSFPKVLNLLDFQVFELARVCTEYPNYDYGYSTSYRVAISLKPNCPELVIVLGGELLHCKLGVDGSSETYYRAEVRDHAVSEYEDVICYLGKFYSVARDGRAVVVDSNSLKATMIAAPLNRGGSFSSPHKKSLVESLGELLLVDRNPDTVDEHGFRLAEFKVYKLNAAEKQWVEMRVLGDRILYVGNQCCFSVSTRDFPGHQGNCIYYYRYNELVPSTISGIGVFCLDGAQLANCTSIFYPNLASDHPDGDSEI